MAAKESEGGQKWRSADTASTDPAQPPPPPTRAAALPSGRRTREAATAKASRSRRLRATCQLSPALCVAPPFSPASRGQFSGIQCQIELGCGGQPAERGKQCRTDASALRGERDGRQGRYRILDRSGAAVS